ncbi:peptidase [Saccharopolyspora cebuensis]|uniref:Peptidase n=1 Tax=Saccharopolyspora cebuensis TaxID=418759 RepID=A0ABV4CE15_9PSEU
MPAFERAPAVPRRGGSRAPRVRPRATGFPARRALLAALALITALTGCTAPADDVVLHTVDPAFVHGTDHGDTDRIAATAVTEVQRYWAAEFPAVFGAPWRDLDGGFFSVDPNGAAPPPPCSADAEDVEGNAYYCATVDAIAWDRAALLPVLREHYGDAAVLLVLSHELGHAVQQRTGMDVGGGAYPIRVEAMADCYAGAFFGWVAAGGSEHLRLDAGAVDGALRALLVFRDPVGTTTHGTAFARISAFQDGLDRGAGHCAELAVPEVAEPGPDDPVQPLDDPGRTARLDAFFAEVVAQRGGAWPDPRVRSGTAPGCPRPRPVAACAEPPTVLLDRAALAEVDHDIGDRATGTALASRYALTALRSLGRPTTGPAAGTAVLCLTGAATASDPALSPADLDEAVEAALVVDGVSADAAGRSALTGSERVTALREGVLGGAPACLPPR